MALELASVNVDTTRDTIGFEFPAQLASCSHPACNKAMTTYEINPHFPDWCVRMKCCICLCTRNLCMICAPKGMQTTWLTTNVQLKKHGKIHKIHDTAGGIKHKASVLHRDCTTSASTENPVDSA